jgi:hypothetical protein
MCFLEIYVVPDQGAFNPPLDRRITDLTEHLRVHWANIEPNDWESPSFTTKLNTDSERGLGDTERATAGWGCSGKFALATMQE